MMILLSALKRYVKQFNDARLNKARNKVMSLGKIVDFQFFGLVFHPALLIRELRRFLPLSRAAESNILQTASL